MVDVVESGTSCPSYGKGGRGHKGFALATAQSTGQSKRTINRSVRRAEHICDEAMALIGGSLVDSGVFLDRLVGMHLPAREQVAYVRQAVADAKFRQQTRELNRALPKALRITPPRKTRVDRALELVTAMTPEEREDFADRLRTLQEDLP